MPKKITLDWTLDELAGKFDAHLGRETNIAGLIADWCDAAAIEAGLKSGSDYRREHDRRIEAAVGQHSPDEPEKILRRIVSAPKPRRVLAAKAVKLRDPRGYAAARRPVVYARIGGPATAGHEVTLPTLTGRWWLDMERITSARRDAAERLKASRDAIVALLDEAGWDEATYETTDGYRLGRDTALRWSRDAYIEAVGEQAAAKLMVDAPAAAPSVRFVLGSLSREEMAEMELDAD